MVRGHSDSDRRARFGVWAALAGFALAVFGIVWLVSWRFDPEQGLTLGAVAIPQWIMAMLFGTILLVDVTARTYLVSEIRSQYERRRKRFDKLSNSYLKGAAAHDVAWAALSDAIQDRLDQARRIEAAGARVLSDAEARFGYPYRRHSLPPRVHALRASERADGDFEQTTTAVPNTESLRLINPSDMLAPQGVLANGIRLLTTCRSRSPEQARQRVDEVWEALQPEPEPESRERPSGAKSPRHPIGMGGHGADAVVTPR
jgi:hypothetical protein